MNPSLRLKLGGIVIFLLALAVPHAALAAALSFAAPKYIDMTPDYYANGVASGDFNGDGKLDLAVATNNGVSIFLGNGAGTFQHLVDYATGQNPNSIIVGDFNGDGKLDLVTSNFGFATVSVWLGNGDGTFQTQVDYATGNLPFVVVASDFNGDGKADLAVANANSGTISILLGNSDGTFQAKIDTNTGVEPFGLAPGDFNGDGKLDLAVGYHSGSAISILLGNGDGTFQPKADYVDASWHQSMAVAAADLDGDGILDLAVGQSTGVTIMRGKGDGTFVTTGNYSSYNQSEFVSVGDFNGDNIPDVLAGRVASNYVDIWRGNGDGSFQPSESINVGGGGGGGFLPTMVTMGDFNGDGKPDLVLGNQLLAISLNNSNLAYALSVGIDTSPGTGSGTVNSNSYGIACSALTSFGCSTSIDASTTVSLTATPDWKSLFGSWGGDCAGSGNPCSLAMDGAKSVSVAFVPNIQVAVSGDPSPGYASLQDAYAVAADSSTLRAKVYTFYENLDCNQAKTITLAGGNNDSYQSTGGFTTLQGVLTISGGTVNIGNFIIE